MATNFVINISGSLLASLFYEHVNSTSDQEGFLIGELMSQITDTISDSQMYSEKEENCINIHTFVPCSKLFSFYNSYGFILQDKLEAILGGKEKSVIGWYRFRRNTSLRVSLRETTIHSNLAKVFATSASKFFVFGLFTENLSANDSTYSFDHIFVRERNQAFDTIPLNIINLGDTSHSEYQTFSQSITTTPTGPYRSIIMALEDKYKSSEEDPGVKKIEHVHKSLQNKLGDVQEELVISEAMIANLSQELFDLKSKIRSLETLNMKQEAISNLSRSSSSLSSSSSSAKEKAMTPSTQPESQ